MKDRNRKWLLCLLFLVAACLMGCTSQGQDKTQNLPEASAGTESNQNSPEISAGAEGLVIGLILTSQDAEENDALISEFEELSRDLGAELLVGVPEVSWEAAKEARNLTEDFVLCEVDPIEYQMLHVNEMVAENAAVIAIHANHSEALEPVLTAARSVGIQVCAFEQEVGEESCDVLVSREEAAEAVRELVQAK